MKRFLSSLAVAALSLGAVFFAAPTASAGNGTNDYYIKKTCKIGTIGTITLHVSTWDIATKGRYHIGWTRSGFVQEVTGIYFDGSYVGKSSSFYQDVPGHAAHTVRIYGKNLGSPIGNCAVTL